MRDPGARAQDLGERKEGRVPRGPRLVGVGGRRQGLAGTGRSPGGPRTYGERHGSPWRTLSQGDRADSWAAGRPGPLGGELGSLGKVSGPGLLPAQR